MLISSFFTILVDRVLRQQKAKREQELREQEQMAQNRKSDDRSSLNTLVSSQSSSVTRQDKKPTGLFSNWRQRISRPPSVASINGVPSVPNLPGSFPGGSHDVFRPTGATGDMPWNKTSGEGITPQKDIERNVLAAIEVRHSHISLESLCSNGFVRPADLKVMQSFAAKNIEPT